MSDGCALCSGDLSGGPFPYSLFLFSAHLGAWANWSFISLHTLYSFLLLSVLCNGSASRLCDQSPGFQISFLNSYYLHSTQELDKPECQDAGLIKQCGYIAGTCHRRKTNVTHSLKLFGNRPLGFYIFFLGQC